jgi:molybdate transport system substrate-binding protein
MAKSRYWFRLTPLAALASVAACSGTSGQDSVKVSSATSLKAAVTSIARSYGDGTTQLEFAGSDAIATAIRSGRKPDAFLAASLKAPEDLAADGLVDQPLVFARNRIVVAVAATNSSIRSISNLGRPGVTIAIGSPSVPIGSYADKIIEALPPATAAQVRANVKTREPDAASVSAKVTSGSVDAAVLYATDVKATNGALKAIAIPLALGPVTKCAAAVVKGTGNEAAAAKFIQNLLTTESQRILVAKGFLPAPKR